MEKTKCVCEYLKEIDFHANYVCSQDFQFDSIDIMENGDAKISLDYYPTLSIWKLSAYGAEDFVEVSINYCPFCGRKLN